MAAVAVLVVLVVAPAAAAKSISSLVVVGANGASVELPVRDTVFEHMRCCGWLVRSGGGRYLLVYPMMRAPGIGAGVERALYFPRTHAYCGWSLVHGYCRRLDGGLRRAMASTRLEPLRGTPTTLASLTRRGSVLGQSENIRLVFEAAFARSDWRRAIRPRGCSLAYSARWRGPEAPSRPHLFCLSPRGVWSRGSLYPLDRAYYEFARMNG